MRSRTHPKAVPVLDGGFRRRDADGRSRGDCATRKIAHFGVLKRRKPLKRFRGLGRAEADRAEGRCHLKTS